MMMMTTDGFINDITITTTTNAITTAITSTTGTLGHVIQS